MGEQKLLEAHPIVLSIALHLAKEAEKSLQDRVAVESEDGNEKVMVSLQS